MTATLENTTEITAGGNLFPAPARVTTGQRLAEECPFILEGMPCFAFDLGAYLVELSKTRGGGGKGQEARVQAPRRNRDFHRGQGSRSQGGMGRALRQGALLQGRRFQGPDNNT